MAGLHTARLLRGHGFGGRVTLVGSEDCPPYDRPPLSKGVLAGTVGSVGELAFPVDLAVLDVDVRYGERGVSWSPGTVTLSSGAAVAYDALVLATGSEPMRIGAPDHDSVHTLRSYGDALRLRKQLKPGAEITIVGAGWIGAEVATAARAAGCDVVVVEAQPWPLAAMFPEVIGSAIADWYAAAGVDLELRSQVASLHGLDDGRIRILLDDGECSETDTLLVAVGARPDVRWLGDAFDYAADGALLVDEHLATSVPGVFAVGDCAAYNSLRYGRHIRVEHWDNALRGPETVATNVLGGTAVHDPVPYFWSEQFGRMVQYIGRHSGADQLVLRGDLTEASWSAVWLDASAQVTAVLAVGKPRDLAQGRKLITASAVLDEAKVADTSLSLSLSAPLSAATS